LDGRKAGVDLLVRAGASVWIDRGVRIAHSKTMVIDGKITLVGSMNWSRGAALNSGNLNLVVSPGGRRNLRGPLAAAPRRRSAVHRPRRVVPAAHCAERPVRPVSRLLWQALDWLDYRVWDLRLRVADALYGPEPETEADRDRNREGPRGRPARQESGIHDSREVVSSAGKSMGAGGRWRWESKKPNLPS
jgi:phosphatidylserine/phosphatidylglycerophosphate/cardiolipin synthase-like enzyme